MVSFAQFQKESDGSGARAAGERPVAVNAADAQGRAKGAAAAAATGPVTRFGSKVDVRNRGAVRIRRLAGAAGIGGRTGSLDKGDDAPAVVRLWHADQCDELTIAEARALAAQLLAAAAFADGQNRQ